MSRTTLPFVVQHLGLVLEHLDELLLRRGRHVDEQLLHPRPVEHLAGAAIGRVARDPGDRAGEALQVLRELVLELSRDVDVRVQRLDHRGGDQVADLVVGDQLLRGLRKWPLSSASRLTKFESRLMTRKTMPRMTRMRAAITRPRDTRCAGSGARPAGAGAFGLGGGIGHDVSSAPGEPGGSEGCCRRGPQHEQSYAPSPRGSRSGVCGSGAAQRRGPRRTSTRSIGTRGCASYQAA